LDIIKDSLKEFSKITKPMTKLLGKDKKFKWCPPMKLVLGIEESD
jgi:hypothetical protein